MSRAIQEAVLEEGNHTLPPEHISDGVFSCYGSRDHTIYRTTITGTRSLNADKAVFYIQKWVELGKATQVEWYMVYFDPECPAHLSSLNKAECSGN